MSQAELLEDEHQRNRLQLSRNNEEVASVWLGKIKRLIKQRDFKAAFINIGNFVKFSNQHGFVEMKYEAELCLTQVYIELRDFSQAMIHVTKIIQALEEHHGDDLGKQRQLAELRLCEIEMNLDPYLHDALKRIHSKTLEVDL